MVSKYREIFGKVVPFVFPVVLAGALIAQSDVIEGETIHGWIKEAVNKKTIDPSIIPAFGDKDYFTETFNKLSSREKKSFIADVCNNIANAENQKILMLTVHPG